MQLGYMILYVQDVRHAIEFYERAFALERRMIHEDGDYGELATGSTVLAFAALDFVASTGKSVGPVDAARACFEIAFVTDDVQAAVSRAIEAGATEVQAPEKMPWGQTLAYVRDDSGFLIEICTAVSPP